VYLYHIKYTFIISPIHNRSCKIISHCS